MAVQVSQFEFQGSVVSGNQTIASSLGFTPTGYIIWSSNNTLSASYQDHSAMFVGFSDGTTTRSLAFVNHDNFTAGRGHTYAANDFRLYSSSTTTPTAAGIGTHSSFGSGTIVVNWTTAPGNIKFYGIAFGGDISCEVNGYTVGDTSTGNHNYTTTMSNPAFGIFLIPDNTASIPSSNTDAQGGAFSLGFAKSSTKRCLIANTSEYNVPNMDTWSLMDDTICAGCLVKSTGAIQWKADFVSWNANGFTLNVTDAAASASAHFYAMTLKGANFDMGMVAARTSTGTTTVNPSSVGDVKGIILATNNLQKSTSVQAHFRFSLGAASSTSAEGGCWTGDQSGVGDSVCVKRSDDSNILIAVTEHATAISSTMQKTADISAVGTDTFTINYSTATATAMDLIWVAIGESAFVLHERSINESAISVGAVSNAGRLLTAFRTQSESSISVSDANTRVKTMPRSISEAAITVSETLARVKIGVRSISESAISVSETLARILFANRTLTGPVTVSETLARVLIAPRSISESGISVSETVSGNKFTPKTITESAITVSEALTRQTFNFRTINENVPVSEVLTRLLTAFRTRTESSISVSDVTEGHILLLRAINEAGITVSETLARQAIIFRTINESSISVSETLTRVLIASRAITESSIAVSETLARTIIRVRSISEAAITVSETLARQAFYNRILNESSISVSETLARLKTIIRIITEPSISVSETLARTLIANRTLTGPVTVSETLARILVATRVITGPVTVSETLTRPLVANRTISESAISVSESLARILIATRVLTGPVTVSETLTRQSNKFRVITESGITVGGGTLTIIKGRFIVINEPAIIVSELLQTPGTVLRSISESVSQSHTVVATVPTQVFAQFITDPGYAEPLRLRITFKSRKDDTSADPTGDQIIYYRYDSYVPTDRPFNLINFNIRLTQGEISTASFDIEDHRELIDDPRKIAHKSIVEIDFKKELGAQWTRIMTGYVRRLKRSRPAFNSLIYHVVVYSKQVIYNERILNMKRAAKRAVIDSNIPLSTDTAMQVNNLFREIHTATDILPRKTPTLQQHGDFDLDTGTISEDVIDFVTEFAPGLTTAAETINQLTEGSGSIWGVDEFGNPYLRYPTEKHSGIIIKDDPQDTDSALNTSVNMGPFEFEDIFDVSEGAGNRLFVLNSKDTKSIASSSKGSGFTTLTTRWIAQSFIATDNNITGAAFILSRIGEPSTASGVIKGLLRASSTNGRFPTGPTLATFEISISALGTSSDVIFVNDIKTKEGVIVPGQRYWWVLQGTGLFDDTKTVKWHHDNDMTSPIDTQDGSVRPVSATGAQVDVDPTKPGLQFNWIRNEAGPTYAFSTFASINHILTQSDSESIKEHGLIESVVNLPAFDDDATFQKALVKILANSAKMKRIYDVSKVTIPTQKLFKPGEAITVIDSKAKLTAEKLVNAEIVEVSYVFNTQENALGCKYCELRLVGFVDPFRDNFLENREC